MNDLETILKIQPGKFTSGDATSLIGYLDTGPNFSRVEPDRLLRLSKVIHLVTKQFPDGFKEHHYITAMWAHSRAADAADICLDVAEKASNKVTLYDRAANAAHLAYTLSSPPNVGHLRSEYAHLNRALLAGIPRNNPRLKAEIHNRAFNAAHMIYYHSKDIKFLSKAYDHAMNAGKFYAKSNQLKRANYVYRVAVDLAGELKDKGKEGKARSMIRE